MLKVIAIDCGASNGRVMRCEFSGEIINIEEQHRFENRPVQILNDLYWNTTGLAANISDGLRLSAQYGKPESIGIDTWGVDFALIDADGSLVHMPFSYRGRHSEGMMEQAFSVVPREEIYHRTGTQFLRFNTIYQLLGILKNRPQMLESAAKMVMIADLLEYFLSGQASCEYSMATTTQLFSLYDKNWDFELIRKLNLPEHIFGAIINPGTITGKLNAVTARNIGFQSRVIKVAAHDTASAVLAIPKTSNENSIFLSSGTWSLIGIEKPEPLINDAAYAWNFTNEGAYGGGIRVLKNVMGLWILQQLKNAWCEEGYDLSWTQIIQEAGMSSPFVCFIDPDDPIFLEPGEMMSSINEYCSRTGQNNPRSFGSYVRTVLECLALKYRYCIEGLKKISEKTFDVIHIIGGGCQNALLNQFTASATGLRVLAGPSEATVMGNAFAQLIALGEVKDVLEAREIITRSVKIDEYFPCESDAWENAYGKFKQKTGLNNL